MPCVNDFPIFRRPAAEDFQAIVALLGASGLPSADLSLPALAHFRIARDGNRIVAVGGIQPVGQVGLLRSVCVAPDHRSRGLAASLVATLEAEAMRLRLDTLYLLTNNAGAWFARAGYETLARIDAPASVRDTAEFKELCPDTASCMYKVLQRAARPWRDNDTH